MILLLMTGCYGTRYLKNDEKLLSKQNIKGNEVIKKDELTPFYRQEPNRKFIGLFSFYVWLYQAGENKYDVEKYKVKIADINQKYDQKDARKGSNQKKSNRINNRRKKKVAKVEKTIADGNMFMRWGEPLAVIDSQHLDHTKTQLVLFLQSKGFFEAEANYTIKYEENRAEVKFMVKENEPYILDTLMRNIADTNLKPVISLYNEKSLLKPGERYDQAKITNERTRLESLLKDHGYFAFNRRFVEFDIDTAYGDHRVAIRTIIHNQVNGSPHKTFRIDSIIFTTDANSSIQNETRTQVSYNGITYNYFRDLYSSKILDRRIFLRPGEIYSRSNTLETQQQLTNMNVFRFVNINYDSTGGKFVANIFSSARKRQQFTSELGFTLTYGYPGPFIDIGYVIRNVFHGLENLQFSLRGAIEGVPSATDFTNILASTEGSFNVSLIIPQFLIPGSEALKNQFGRFNPKTRVTVGYSLNDRPEYIRNSVDASLDYTWSTKKKRTFSLYLADLMFINTTFQDSTFYYRLKELENQGNNLINSFLPSFVSSTSFTSAYNYGNYGQKFGQGAFLRFGVESGGTFQNIYGNSFFNERGLQTYKYLKADVDFRKRIKIANNTRVAYRATFGIAYPYSKDQLLPYEKYFFSGGATSIRAWRPRRLGPGSFTPTDDNGNVSYNVEQPGEILLEMGAELRQGFTKLIEGALFVDAGNIWVMRDTDNRKELGGGLEGFYKEIAVGAGAGIRFDLTFFLVRIDAAFKIYDPARLEGNRFILNPGFFDDPVNKGESNEFPLINFAIGYPF